MIEQTSNHGMGRVWPLNDVAAIGAAVWWLKKGKH